MTAAPNRLALAEVLQLRSPTGAPGCHAPGHGVRLRGALSRALLHWLIDLWQEIGAPDQGVALACSGSLARRDSGPLSDIDLVVLHEPAVDPVKVAALAQQLWYPIWDSGIALDHAVRSVKQCRQVASRDLNVAGAMLDLSPVAGDAELVRRGVKQLAEDWRANARKRLPELLRQVEQRHERFGELAQMLEPDLKDAKGGLRDMSILRAMTASWLADRPHGAVDEAYNFLLDVRDTLHIVTGRPRNLLTLSDQDEVAQRQGLGDADELLSQTGTAARRISSAVDATLRRASQSQRARLSRRGPRRPELTPLHPGIFSHDGEIVLGPVRGGTAEDQALLAYRAAATASTTDLPLSPVTTRKLAELPPVPEPWPDNARLLFTQMLAGPGLLHTWNALDLSGVVDQWLPEWAAIRDRPQRTALHRHTVDRHSIEAVLEATRLIDRVDRPDLLLVAALLHDIGKRPGGTRIHTADHSAGGARLVPVIARRMGYGEADTSRLSLLVAEHLTLMQLATNRDPTDPVTAQLLAEACGDDRTNLELLAALSEADARAAGSRTWSTGRASLMRDLVARTQRHLR